MKPKDWVQGLSVELKKCYYINMVFSKQKTKTNCKDCGKDIFVRNDYIKIHKGRCQKCASNFKWQNK